MKEGPYMSDVIRSKININNHDSFAYSLYPKMNDQRLPLVICLLEPGTEKYNIFLSAAVQGKYLCHVLVINSASPEDWDNKYIRKAVQTLIYSLVSEYNMDDNRIYITGEGIGAIGVCELNSAYPKIFAAAIPISGCGDPRAAFD